MGKEVSRGHIISHALLVNAIDFTETCEKID